MAAERPLLFNHFLYLRRAIGVESLAQVYPVAGFLGEAVAHHVVVERTQRGSQDWLGVLCDGRRGGVLFHVGLVGIVDDHLYLGFALAAGLVGVDHGVVAAVVAVYVLERVFAVGGLELVRAFPAPYLAVPRVRAERDACAFFHVDFGRLVPFAVADFHVGDNLGAATRGNYLLAVANADGVRHLDNARLETAGGEGLHERGGLLCGNREHGAVSRGERALRFGILYKLEVFEVGTGRELVMAVVVAVVHQHPGSLVDQLEHARALDGFGGLLQAVFLAVPGARFRPLRGGEFQRPYLADAAVALVLVEGVVVLVGRVVDDVHVDGRLAAAKVEDGVALEVGEVLVRVGEEHLVEFDGAVVGQKREIHERAALAAVCVLVVVVPDGLGGPNAGHVRKVLALVAFREMYRAVFPVDEVLGLHHDDAAVARPALGALHVGVHHVEPAIGPAHHVRVAQSLLHAHGIGGHHALAPVHRRVVEPVVAQRIIDVLVVVCREVNEKVVGIGLVTVDGNLVGLLFDISGFDVGHARRQGDFLVFADKTAIDSAVMAQKERVAAFPGDGDGYVLLDGVGEVHVLVEVVRARIDHVIVECLPERGQLDDILCQNAPCEGEGGNDQTETLLSHTRIPVYITI